MSDIEISTQTIHASFASVINEIEPGANIYDNPNQQGTTYPAWFIVHRSPVEIKPELGFRKGGHRYQLTYNIDIWYMLKQNIPRLYDQYSEVAERLDDKLEYLKIFGTDAVVHVYNRSWSMELSALKFSVTLMLRVFKKTDGEYYKPMEVITDIGTFLKNQEKFNKYTISFRNTTKVGEQIEIPEAITVLSGEAIILPIMNYEIESKNKLWKTVGWDIGEFGHKYYVTDNATATLLWTYEDIPIEPEEPEEPKQPDEPNEPEPSTEP